jgi:hypothetical protein
MRPCSVSVSGLPALRPVRVKSRKLDPLESQASCAGMALGMMMVPFLSFGFILLVLLVVKG